MVDVPGVRRLHCRWKVCWCSAGFVPTHVKEKGSTIPERGWTEVAPGSRVKVPPTDVSRSLVRKPAPLNVPLTCTEKFSASVAVTVMPGTFVHAVEVVEIGVVRVLNLRHEITVPGLLTAAAFSGTRIAARAAAPSQRQTRLFMPRLLSNGSPEATVGASTPQWIPFPSMKSLQVGIV